MAKRSWFSSVRKALSLHSKRANKSKKKWFGKERQSVSASPYPEPFEVSNPHPLPQLENKKLKQLEKERRRHAKAASKAARRTKMPQYAGEPHEEAAAIKIQTAFRGYRGRRVLRGLRGLVRLKSLIDGPTALRQTTNTLKTMQTLSRLQSQIQSTRMRMLDENRALQRELLQKRARELDSLRMAEEWDDSPQSKEEVEASLLRKQEGAMRRERALAYSYTHQQSWKKSKLTNILFTDPTNPHWGWSWLERWIETKKLPPKTASLAARASQRVSQDEESRSVQSERIRRRHSIACSSLVRVDRSLLPTYMTPTRSAKAKNKLQSRFGMESNGVPRRESGFEKKRHSFPH